MENIDNLFTATNARPIWRKLRDSEVPIVSGDDYKQIDFHIAKLRADLASNKYMPSIGHGYLGYPKQAGCTRFVPILTKEDLTVYYLLLLHIQDFLVKPKHGVFGAWRSIPRPVQNFDQAKGEFDTTKEDSSLELDAPELLDPYYDNTFSKRQWFNNWTTFTDLIDETTDRSDIGDYVVTTDIANFYDTINVDKLIERISLEPGMNLEVVQYLRVFLGFWDRRVKGYHFSTQGIPQEIIGDASRTLANYYVDEFDSKIISYASNMGQVYLRWADDMIIFGKSKRSLEDTVHRASRFLLHDGLNLSAPKTRLFSRREFRLYRGIDVLKAIRLARHARVTQELRKFMSHYESQGGRIDTVYRAILGYASRNPSRITPYTMNFLDECSSRYELLASLDYSKLRQRIDISGQKKEDFIKSVSLLCRYPYAAGRASVVKLFRNNKPYLRSIGLTDKKITSLLEHIRKNSGNSEIIEKICIPAAY